MKKREYYDVVDADGRACVEDSAPTLREALRNAREVDNPASWHACDVKSHKRPHRIAVFVLGRYEEYVPTKAKEPKP